MYALVYPTFSLPEAVWHLVQVLLAAQPLQELKQRRFVLFRFSRRQYTEISSIVTVAFFSVLVAGLQADHRGKCGCKSLRTRTKRQRC